MNRIQTRRLGGRVTVRDVAASDSRVFISKVQDPEWKVPDEYWITLPVHDGGPRSAIVEWSLTLTTAEAERVYRSLGRLLGKEHQL